MKLPRLGHPRLLLVLAGPATDAAACPQGRAQSVATTKRRRFLRRAVVDALKGARFSVLRLAFPKESPYKDKDVLAVGLPFPELCAAAEECGLPKKQVCYNRSGYMGMDAVQPERWRPFARHAAEKNFLGYSVALQDPGQGFFEPSEVLSVLRWKVYRLHLRNYSGDASLDDGNALVDLAKKSSVLALAEHAGVLEEVTALHENADKERLLAEWPKIWQVLREMPYKHMVRYFGIEIAQYFRFVNTYAAWVCFPALLGVVGQVMHYTFYKSHKTFAATPLAMLYVVLVTFWITLLVEQWKRKRITTKFEWGQNGSEVVVDMSAPASFVIAPDKLSAAMSICGPCTPPARGVATDFSAMKVDSSTVALLRFVFTVPAMFFLFGVSAAVVHLLLFIGEIAPNYVDNFLVKSSPAILYCVVVFVFEKFYNNIASTLTCAEKHTVYAEHMRMLTARTAFFQIVNYVGWFVYIAFRMQDLVYLRWQLLLFCTVKQLFALCNEVVVPRLMQVRKRNAIADSSEKAGMKELGGARGSDEGFGNCYEGEGRGSVVGDPPSGARSVRSCFQLFGGAHSSSSFEGTAASADATVNAAEAAAAKALETRLIKGCEVELGKLRPELSEDYLQLAVLFTVTSCFAVVFPLGPLFALVFVLVTRWSDAFKYLKVGKRLVPSPINEVVSDTWLEIFEGISTIAVMSNMLILAMASPDRWTALELVVFEHVILAFKAYLAWSIPDQPEWVTFQESMFEEWERQDAAGEL